MQVSIETTSGLERRLTVGVPAERVDAEVDTRLKKAAKNVRLPGFRPGKVPMKVMQQRFGAGVRQEVLGDPARQLRGHVPVRGGGQGEGRGAAGDQGKGGQN